MKPLIIGVDPGSTSAVSAIDFEGENIFTVSRKNFPPREIISEIIDNGRPVVIASDKAKFPSTVDKIASSLGAYRYTIENDMSSERKQELGQGENSHEIDASAAARNAYRGLRDGIETVKQLSGDKDFDIDKIAVRYFKDELDKKEIEQKDDFETERPEVDSRGEEDVFEDVDEAKRNVKLSKENERLWTKVENLESQISNLKESLKSEKEDKQRWRSKYDRMRTEKRKELMEERLLSKKKAELDEKDRKIEELEERVEKASIREKQYLKALDLIEKGGELFRLYESCGRDGEVFFTRSEDVEEILKDKGEHVFHVDEVDGVELFDRIVLTEVPEKDVRDVLEEYRDGR